MKKFIYLIIATLVAILTVKVDALTNNGKLYMQYYTESGINVFASDERYHALDYNAIAIKSSEDNEVYYCIEPEVSIPLYSEAVSNSHTIYEGEQNIIDMCRLTDKNYDRVSLLSYYGYGYKDNAVNHNSKKWYGIAQVLIWKTVRPDVDYVFKTSRYGSLDTNLYKKEIGELENLISNHSKVPSFSNTDIILVKGEKMELVDTNNVLNTFLPSSNDIVNIEIKNNTLYLEGVKDGEATITFTKPKANYNFRLYRSNTLQNIVSRGNVDNPSFKLNIKVVSGVATIKKVDEENNYNENLSGTVFSLYDINDNFINDIKITCEKETIYLPEGKYYLKEKVASTGYKLNDKKYEFEINSENKDVEVVIPNAKIKGTLILEKYKGGADENFVLESDATFEIYKGDTLVDLVTTDENGITKIELEYGRYLIKQVKGSPGYSYVDNFEVFIEEEKEYKYELQNIKKSILEITKTDYSSGKVLSNATIGVYDMSDNLIHQGVTDENGILKIENLDIGKYYLKEIKAPKYYKLSDEKIYFENDKDGKVIKINMTNERNTGTLKFYKIDGKTQELLKDAKIRITYLDTNEIIYEGLTNELGEITLENINAGTYSIKEITPPYGYLLKDKEITFEIVEDKDIRCVIMTNEKIEMPNTYMNFDNLKILGLGIIILTCSKFIKKKRYEK